MVTPSSFTVNIPGLTNSATASCQPTVDDHILMGTSHPVTVLEGVRCGQRANGTAAVLALGTSNPANCVRQQEYSDWYFRVTKSDHLAQLRDKMKRICEKSGIKNRYFHHTEEMIAAHPEFLDRALPSLRTRLGITTAAMPELAAAAARKAIAEWGRPAADITHLVVSTSSGVSSPGADVRVAALLGLRPTVRRVMHCLHGCAGGSVALRLAKDLAENNLGARVLVVGVEATALAFRGPDVADLDALLAMALFGDGAGAAVVGAGPMSSGERPIFHMLSASQVTLPETDNTVGIKVTESGLHFKVSPEMPKLVGENIKRCLADTLAPFGLASDWNGVFWAAVPASPAILDTYQAALGLEPGKLAASRRVLSEYGNMLAATIFFVLDQMRCRRGSGNKEGRENCEWGVMLAIGPGITVEMMVLQAADTGDKD
ncbi:hypothetical protein PR202_gb13294 [Eleusine coracana subsp. coracana]|uniref:Chalcone synthase n=1 Tax=Eleusine coracana subsp. coracana TaxID=191504 RepID=A0AAV5ETC8_ELECO|nr:hypothetical protein QOZ80_9BG0712950 [Eleusine coracana subsp. coracana]GJN25465.1 hypothetical protein PR202_gb13294 [Eleusine coracana subsp. coracana]